MAWQPPATDAVSSGAWKPPTSDAVAPSTNGSSKMDVAMAALGQAQNLAPWNKITKMRQTLGGDIAEAGGYLGAKIANAGFPATGDAIQSAGVGLGSIPAIGPEVLSAYAGLKGIYNSPSPTVQGLVNTPQELSPQYAAQNQAIGISNDVPETAGKVQYENPYQYPSQLSKPKYVPVKQPDLPVVQQGATTGDPHALFAYNDQVSPDIAAQSKYQVWGDKSRPVFKDNGGTLTHGSQATIGELQDAGVPVVGRTQRSIDLGHEPLDLPKQPTIFQPIENPNAPAFARPKLSYPADTGPGAAQPLPSTVPTKYPDDPGTLINMANQRISEHGTNLTPQELSDMKTLIQTKMANGDIPKFGPDGKMTQIFAQATQAQKNISNTLNQVAEPLLKNAQLPEGTLPTRAGLNQAYSLASKQQAVMGYVKRYGLKGAEAGLGALGAKQLYDYFRK